MLSMPNIANWPKFMVTPQRSICPSIHNPSLRSPNLCPKTLLLFFSSPTLPPLPPPPMAVEPKLSVVTIGGKGSALTPSSVYFIANSLCLLKIDSSLLEKLASNHPISSNLPNIINPNPKVLTLIESRAALFVLLNKLLITPNGVRPLLPTLIAETLNRGFEPKSLDFGSTIGFLRSFYRLNEKTLEEVGVTDGELVVMENSCCEFNGICAVLDYSSTALSTVADAVGALSCEASKADVSGALNFVDSGDGFSAKDAAGVASDLKVLLVGSKLVGKVESSVVSEIPNVHGSLREVVRLVHSRIRVELNSSVKGGKLGLNASVGIKKALVTAFLPLGSSLMFLGENSLDRSKLIIDSIDNIDTRSRVLKLFESSSKKFEGLRDGLQTTQASYGFEFVHELFNLMVGVREVIALEGALALFVLEINELSEKNKEAVVASSKVEANTGKQNVEKKAGDKKKKKMALGKGTAVIKQLIKGKLRIEIVETVTDTAILSKWAQDLSLFFDPKDVELDAFLKQVKELVESNETRRIPKVPKGTRDFAKEQMTIRERAFSIIEQVFKRHGATALDTPAFELRETLMGKYGEDSKLIYDLADQGGELCSLRYDLTVPFARYVAMNGITTFKRYQIAKVYRRDNPSKGRYREFYQCDFDIAGQYEVMAPEFEVIRVLTELLDQLNIGDYEVKLNHRKLLDGMLEICGVPPEKFRTICSSIDKLDKQSFEQIKKEMVEEKGLTVETADKIGNLVKKRGNPLDILSELKQDGSQFLTNEGSVDALKDLEILFKALEKSRCINRVVFDLSLARGLDYYTGVIYEAVFKGATQVGSIAAGGRYDNLIGMFGTKQVPAIGVSLGIERVFTIMEQLVKDQNQSVRATETEVLVGILGEDLSQAAELVSELWDAKLKAEFMMHKKDIMKLITRAERSSIPWMVIQGEKELNEGIVKLRNTNTREEIPVARSSIVEELKKRLSSTS